MDAIEADSDKQITTARFPVLLILELNKVQQFSKLYI